MRAEAPGFTALAFSDTAQVPAALAELERTLAARGVPFQAVPVTRHLDAANSTLHAWDHTGRLFGTYDAAPGTVYLVRPDGHVLGRWREARLEELGAAIDGVLGK